MFRKIYDIINENGIISSLIASALFALVLFSVSMDKRILTYDVVSNQKLFSSSESNALIILDKDSQSLDRNIYYIEIDIWNQGNKAIEVDNIKEDLSLVFDNDVRILTPLTIQETHPVVTRAEAQADTLLNGISLSFDFLEDGNGIKLKGYYMSEFDNKSEVALLGYISRGGEIKTFKESFFEKHAISTFIILTSLFGFIGYYVSNYIGGIINRIVGRFIDRNRYRIWNWIVYYSFAAIIVYFLAVKVLGVLPIWIRDGLGNYFNPASPFS